MDGAIYRGSTSGDTALVFPTGWFRAWAVYSRAKEFNHWINDESEYLPDYEESEPISKGLMVW